MTMLFANRGPGLLTGLIDLLIPPRASERVVRTLTLSALRALMEEDALPYHDPRITALVWELKYYGNARAVSLGGALLRDPLIAAAAEELGTPLVIPVPMHPARRRERGFNHTELLCETALRGLPELAYAPQALVRAVDTPTQQGLPRGKRLSNVRDSMRASPLVAGRACIVVDDVSTTGATLAEAKRALKAAGARHVALIALARS